LQFKSQDGACRLTHHRHANKAAVAMANPAANGSKNNASPVNAVEPSAKANSGSVQQATQAEPVNQMSRREGIEKRAMAICQSG
jgi:hypothetical protein